MILLVLAAATAGFVLLFERRQPDTHERAERARLLLDLPVTAVRKMEFTNAAGRVRLEPLPSGRWQLTAPVKDRADQAAVAEILKLASTTEVLNRLEDEKTPKKKELKELGFEAAQQARVVFYLDDNRSFTVTLGDAAAMENTVYAQVQEGDDAPDGVLVARAGQASRLLGRPPGEWRDPRLLEAQVDDLRRVAFRSGESPVEIERELLSPEAMKNFIATWRVTQPVAERADQKLLDEDLLPVLTQARAAAFNEQPAGLGAEPIAAIRLWSRDGPAAGELLEIFADTTTDEHAWARVAGRPGFARTGPELLAFRLATLDRLRDQMLTSLDPGTLTTIILKDAQEGETPLFLFRRQWFVSHDQLVHEANRARVKGLIDALNHAGIMEFFDEPGPPEDYGLDAPFLEIVFGTATHPARTRLQAPTPADSSVLQLGLRQNRFYARWQGRPIVYQFDGSALGDVPRHWLKYKSPRLLSFSPLALRRLVIAQDPHPPLELTFDLAAGAKWQAERQGADVTEFLDHPRLERLVTQLSELEARDWAADPSLAQEALRRPTLRIEVQVESFDESSSAPVLATAIYSFAPTTPGQRTALYYGQKEGETAVFILNRQLFDALAAPVLQAKPAAIDQ